MDGDCTGYADFIFFRGQFYALDLKGRLLICQVGARLNVTKIMEIVAPRTAMARLRRQYLVEYSGGLLMVDRIFSVDRSIEDKPSYKRLRTCGFKVYKLDVSGNGSSWLEVRDLGGDSLFLGKNSSLSISSADFPGYKGNRIYFTDDNRDVNDLVEFRVVSFDMGAYDLDDGMIESLPVPGYGGHGKNLCRPPPIWVMPKAY